MTVVGGQGRFPQTIRERITEVVALTGSFHVFGDSLVEVGSGSSYVDSNGIYRRLTTTTALNDHVRIDGLPMYNRQRDITFYCKFRLGSTSNIRAFIGLTTGSASGTVNTDTPSAGSQAGLYINSGFSTTFGTIRGSGGAATIQYGVLDESLDTQYHELFMWVKKSGGGNNFSIQLDNDDRVEYTTTLPSTTAQMQYVVAVGNRAASTRYIEIAKLTISQKV